MKTLNQKIVSALLIVSTLLQYNVIFVLPNISKVEAQTTDEATQTSDSGLTVNNGFDPGNTADDVDNSQSDDLRVLPLISTFTAINQPVQNSILNNFGTNNKASIVLKKTDYESIKALYCIRQAIPDYPDYNTDLDQLAKDAATYKIGNYTVDQLKAMQSAYDLATRTQFFDVTRQTLAARYSEDKIKELVTSDTNLTTLQCITGLSTNQVRNLKANNQEEYRKVIENSLNATKIDIRIIKTLVYLVTPVNQGGAGHRRVRAHRIFQHKEYSTESDALLGEVNDQSSGQTAADVGTSQRESADATIEDPNGNAEADAWFDNMTNQEDTAVTVNRSAHADGQGVDISEVDDIRCTVIKRRQLGRDSRIKQDPQPVKLAWQTSDSYNSSGGNNTFDFMELLRNQVRDMYQNFALEYGTDISGYEGDLSNAQLGDLASLMGRALFSESINSPGQMFNGQNVEAVADSLGQAYLADLFKVPRSILMGRDFSAVDDISTIVGEAVVEQKTSVPVGIFEPIDQKLLKADDANLLDLYLRTIGRRRLAYEMNLGLDDLEHYQEQTDTTEGVANTGARLVGKKAIEKAFALAAGAFDADNFSQVKNKIGPVKSNIFTLDPDYVDKTLHIPLGSTKTIVKNPGSAIKLIEYLALVGQTRIDDTVNGFKYLAAHDIAYSLPEETWTRVINGDPAAWRELGVFEITQAFAEDGDDNQNKAIAAMVNNTLNLPADQDNQCLNNNLTQVVAVDNAQGIREERRIVVSEQTAQNAGLVSGELCRAFARKSSQASAIFERIGEKHIYNTLLEKVENEDPDFLVEGGNIPFRVQRLHRMMDLVNGIKDNWDKLRQDERLQEDKEFIAQADSIIKLLETVSVNIQSVDVSLAMDQIKQATSTIVDFKRRIEQKKRELPDLQDQINTMIDQINEAYRCGAEAIEGRELPSLDQIEKPDDIIRRETGSTTSSDSGRANPDDTRIRFSAVMVYGLLKRVITPRDFFQQLATAKLEAELNLPQNSLTYYIQNMEARDINGIDAFFQAIGQAKIEQELGLPAYYFQGPIFEGLPDFNSLRLTYALGQDNPWQPPTEEKSKKNLELLVKYYNQSDEILYVYSNFRFPAKIEKNKDSTTQSIVDLYVGAKFSKDKNAIPAWNRLVKIAKRAFIAGQEAANKNSDKTMDDVAKNVDYRQLADGMRAGRTDVMFRLGLSGSLEAAMTPASWRTASFAGNRGRAAEIDHILDVPSYDQSQITNTEALFTGENFKLKDGRDYLTEEEKDDITAPFYVLDPVVAETRAVSAYAAVSRATIDRYLQFLNNEINAGGFKETRNYNIYYNSSNPAVHNSRVDAGGGSCRITWVIRDGIEVADSIQNDAYIYVDANGQPHSFRTEETATAYAKQQQDERSYLDDLSQGLVNIINSLVNIDGIKTVSNPAGHDEISSNYLDQNWLKTRIIEYVQSNRNFDLLPFDKFFGLHGISYQGGQVAPDALKGTRIGDLPGDILVKLFGKTDIKDKPLQWFRAIVGRNEAKRSITQSLIDSLPFTINPDDIAAEDIFAILNGDFRPLLRLGANLIDNGLGLPANTTYAVLTLAESPNPLKDLECTAMDAGAQFLGQLVGLDRVALSGNPADLMRNIGEAKVESVLGLPPGTFYGSSLFGGGLITHMDILDFALAVNMPLETPAELGIAAPINDLALRTLGQMDDVLGTKLADQYQNADAASRVQAVRDNILMVLDRSQITDYGLLQDALDARLLNDVPDIIAHAADKNSPFWQNKYRRLSEEFIARINYIDSSISFANVDAGVFKSSYHSFADVLTQKISPDDYNEIVAKQVAWYLGTDKLMDSIGLDQEQETAIKDLLGHMTCIYYNTDRNSIVGTSCAGWYQNWGKVATDVAQIFHRNLDEDLGLTRGSTEALLNFNPDAPYNKADILINNAAYDLDDRFHLLDQEHNFQWLFARTSEWWHNYSEQRETRALQQQLCQQNINYEAYLSLEEQAAIRSIPAQIQQIAFKARTGGYVCESNNCESEMSEASLTKLTNPDYYWWQQPDSDRTVAPAEVGEVVRLWTQFEVLRGKGASACLSGTRHDDSLIPDSSTLGKALGWDSNRQANAKQLLKDGIRFLAERVSEKISEETKGTVNISADQLIGLFSHEFPQYFMVITTAYGVNTYINNRQNGNGQVETLPPGLQVIPEDITYAFLSDTTTEAALADEARFNALAPESLYVPEDQYRPLGALPEGVDYTSQMAADARMAAVSRNGQDLQGHTVAAVRHDSGDPLYMTGPERQEMDSLYNSTECQTAYRESNPHMVLAGTGAGATDRCWNAYYAHDRLNDARFNTPAGRQTWLAAEYGRLTSVVAQPACQAHLASLQPGQTSTGNSSSEDWTGCETAAAKLDSYDNAANEARHQARRAFRDNLQYRLMDAVLYKMDENVYPGFAWDLLRGSGEQKLRALGNYVLTGLQRGRLFGQDVTILRGTDVRGWASALESIARIETAVSPAERNRQLGAFLNSAGYTTVENWLNDTLWRNFKFRLPAKFLASAFVSIYTGYWFKPNSATTGFTDGQFMAGNSPIPTLGEAAVNWGIEHYENVIFSWADKQTGLPVGTSYNMYNLSKNIYTAAKAIRAYNKAKDSVQELAGIQSFQNALKTVEGVKVGGSIVVNGAEWIRQADGTFTHLEDLSLYEGEDYFVEVNADSAELAGDMTHELVDKALGAAISATLAFALNTATEKLLGDELLKLDADWNLPPGTMMAVAGVATGYLSTAIVHAFIPKFPIMTPEMLAIQLIGVLIYALAGVYEVDVTCTADGYYPEQREASDTVVETGLGEWNGADLNIHRQKSMEAAQYEARQLAGDMLKAQFNPLFADVIPNQIMTGRNEDVNYWSSLINDNICRRIGENYSIDATGVCTAQKNKDGSVGTHTTEERAGVFRNPQNVAFTHIGF